MSDTAEIGYGKPPKAGRFREGQSGNPKGRPKGRHKRRRYDDIFGRKVLIKEAWVAKEVTAAEAFLLSLVKRALEKGGPAADIVHDLAENRRHVKENAVPRINIIAFVGVEPGSVTSAIEPLGMARKLDRYSDKARLVLEPWVVELALGRLQVPLSEDEQREVLAATRTPQKVQWPEWWTVGSERR